MQEYEMKGNEVTPKDRVLAAATAPPFEECGGEHASMVTIIVAGISPFL